MDLIIPVDLIIRVDLSFRSDLIFRFDLIVGLEYLFDIFVRIAKRAPSFLIHQTVPVDLAAKLFE